MIVRVWRGVTPAEKAEQYLAYLMETGVKDYRLELEPKVTHYEVATKL